MKRTQNIVLVLLAGIVWFFAAANVYSARSVDGVGWEFVITFVGSLALGWIAYYAWHKDTCGVMVPKTESTVSKNVTTHTTETTTVSAIASTPSELPVETNYKPIGKYAVYIENDLQIVEGIGPKIDELFANAGIKTWQELASTSTEHMSEILIEAGPRFQFNNPKTWAQQAELAAHGKWKELEELQSGLVGGL